MEPFEKDELSDQELDHLLPRWKAPEAPARLRSAVFPQGSGPWWRRWWSMSITVPMPVACALAVLLAFGVAWMMRPAAVRDRVVVREVERPPAEAAVWRPVAELRPRIIRGAR